MGLDMYLTAEKDFYPSFGDESNEIKNERKLFSKLLSGAGLTARDISQDFPSASMAFKVGYWRKANAIHAWFVKNCQNGVDNCESYHVSMENLIALKTVCVTVLSDNSKATELLPPQSGFFFGGTEVDEWYISNLNDTIEIVDRCSNERFKDWSFKYRSSW